MNGWCCRALVVAVGLTALVDLGCRKSHDNAPVVADKARDTLRAALDSWKKGDKSDALQSASPPIYVIDAEWQGGAVLKDYKILTDGEEKDAHLFCPVRLTVRGTNGQEMTTEVTYIISTAPNLTVSRKLF